MLSITSIPGIEVGHATHPTEKTGCTVILCKNGAVAGIDIRGAAPGTRETELLRPTFMIRHIHAVMLTGGSAFGLRTADGAMQYLDEHKIGFPVGNHVVPIIPTAVIFDLFDHRSTQLPSTEMGYQACLNAKIDFEEGLVGAGKGATVGKILGLQNAMPGGLASDALEIRRGVFVGAIAVVNTFGDIVDPKTGNILAGAREPRTGEFLDTYRLMKSRQPKEPFSKNNTTLAVVATNALLTKEEANKIAMMAQNGIARSTRPAHTMYDGDVVFALSYGKKRADLNLIGEAAAEMVSEAILKAVRISNNL